MKFKYIINSIFLIVVFIFTACSSKYETISDGQVNNTYQDNLNVEIKNSKAMHRATLRPYEVFGKKYYPKIEKIGASFIGIASWYGPNFHSKKTSNGEVYNMYGLSAAHKTLPMNTMVRIKNLENNKEIIVRINDRGPFVGDRIIDLSNKAAHQIDMVKKGTVKVKVTVLGYNAKINSFFTKLDNEKEDIKNMKDLKGEEKNSSVSSYHIQVGAFRKLEGARLTQENYKKLLKNNLNNNLAVKIEKLLRNDISLYKVFIKDFKDYKKALDFKNLHNLKNSSIIGKQ